MDVIEEVSISAKNEYEIGYDQVGLYVSLCVNII